ncbi:DUF55-domain-containing protein [Lyophyllum atratum]|nr:DUF55-domain-containing protein [Lyophyllum atratum]
MATGKYWLLKAEPDPRVVKGKDVKFSVDDFESVKTSPWEGVRNYEARNLMKEMQVGEKALFYHSNCKTPGIAAFAEVSKEAYPDYTAWDASHPYYDAKTKREEPRWFMVDLTFSSRATHFVPLALLRLISENTTVPSEIEYIGESGFKALQTMDLVKKGRLSVQRVDEKAWAAIVALAEKGGWEEMDLKSGKGKKSSKTTPAKPKAKAVSRQAKGKTKGEQADESDDLEEEEEDEDATETPKPKRGRKRKAKDEEDEEYSTAPRRSTRSKR